MKKVKQIFKWLRTQHLAFWILGTLAIVSGTWCEITSKPYITVGDTGCGSSINDLSGAVSAIGSTPCTLVVPMGGSCTGGGVSIPATMNLKVEKGGMINIANGATLIINGTLEAGEYKIFNCIGTGNVHFPTTAADGSGVSKRSLTRCMAAWWGTDGTNNTASATMNATSFQKAIDAINNNGPGGTVSEVYVGPGQYWVNKRIQLYNFITFCGNSDTNTQVCATSDFPAAKTDYGYGVFWIGGTVRNTGWTNCVLPPCIKNLNINIGTAPWNTEYTCIWGMQDTNRWSIENVILGGNGSYISSPNFNRFQGIRLTHTAYNYDGTPMGNSGGNPAPGTVSPTMTESFQNGNGVSSGPFTVTTSHGLGIQDTAYVTYTSGGIQKTIYSDGFGEWRGVEDPTGVYGKSDGNNLSIWFPKSSIPDNGTSVTITYHYSGYGNNHDGFTVRNAEYKMLASCYGALCIEAGGDSNTIFMDGGDFVGCRVNMYSAAYISTFKNFGNEPAPDTWYITGEGGGPGYWSASNVLFNYDGPVIFERSYYEDTNGLIFLIKKGVDTPWPKVQFRGVLSGGCSAAQFMETSGVYGIQAEYVDASHFRVKGSYDLAYMGAEWVILETDQRNRLVYYIPAGGANYDAGTGYTTYTVDKTQVRSHSVNPAPGWAPPPDLNSHLIGARGISHESDRMFTWEDPNFFNTGPYLPQYSASAGVVAFEKVVVGKDCTSTSSPVTGTPIKQIAHGNAACSITSIASPGYLDVEITLPAGIQITNGTDLAQPQICTVTPNSQISLPYGVRIDAVWPDLYGNSIHFRLSNNSGSPWPSTTTTQNFSWMVVR
jgi:hypothetical protein